MKEEKTEQFVGFGRRARLFTDGAGGACSQLHEVVYTKPDGTEIPTGIFIAGGRKSRKDPWTASIQINGFHFENVGAACQHWIAHNKEQVTQEDYDRYMTVQDPK